MKVLIILFLFSLGSFAQTKAQINSMLDQMKASGTFSAEQIEAAKKQLNSMSDKDMQMIKARAEQMQNDPEIQRKIQSIQKGQK